MESVALDFLKQMLAAPSPSGYEQPVQEIVRKYLAGVADRITTDVHGNVIAVRNPEARLRVMLTGHSDQIGFLVNYVDSDGFIYLQAVGGWDPQIALGQRLVVWASDGPLAGVIARKPIHLLTEDERKQVPKIKDLWLDIGAKDKVEAEGLVKVGDPVTLELVYKELRNRRAISPAMDNKTGLWVAVEAFRRTHGKNLNCALYALSTVQEEIGLRGARTGTYTIDPHVAIAIDVTHASDCPTVDKKQEGEVALGKGPVIARGANMNPRLTERLIETAKANNIPYQVQAEAGATGTDANIVQVTRGGVVTGLIGLANRYMHSPVEMVALDDLDNAANLLAQLVLSLKGDEDFVPGV